MKTFNKIFAGLIIINFIFSASDNAFCQTRTRELIQKAMKDELQRNLNNLKLDKLKNPFYISYSVNDGKQTEIKSVLGSIVNSDEKQYRNFSARVMIGDYKLNDENFVDQNNRWGYDMMRAEMPLEDDYNGIRRTLWLATDQLYKTAAENYERKLSAMKQQNLTKEEEELPDFIKTPSTHTDIPSYSFIVDKEKWGKIANDLSAVFINYPDIYSSNVSVAFNKGDMYFVNSEMTDAIYPQTIAMLLVNAFTQAIDGEPLFDQLAYYGKSPDELPKPEVIIKDIQDMINNLLALKKAAVFNESYSGPVLIEGQALAEIFNQRLFSGPGGLLAERKPLYGDAGAMEDSKTSNLEDKIGRKIISNNFSIKATPRNKSFNNYGLIGSFDVDADGVIPQDELMLVDKGMLKTLLNGRVPTIKIKNSNGHMRNEFNQYSTSGSIGPGVISINSANNITGEILKQKLLDAAKTEGLDYAFIIRKLQTNNPGENISKYMSSAVNPYESGSNENVITKPVYIYKVSVSDGKEELVRSSTIGGVSISSLKRITGSSDKQYVYNTLLNKKSNWYGYSSSILAGMPVSYIVPQAALFEELDVEKEKRALTPKLPTVQNPLLK